jgi:acetylornithine deacetylase/succinyl-diaminopimelate desuccinylase-like protein
MAFDKGAAAKILAHIDRNELAQVGCDLASIPSPTGQEKAIAEYIVAWFEANGIKAVRQDVAVDRPNAVGVIKGDGTGLSLGFNGHTDTSFTGTSADLRMVANMEPDAELKGRIVGNKVQGLGISNMKGGLASFMLAGKALKRSGIKLKGDVILACVVGEISRSPIGPWQSQEYRGEGVGTHHLLTHGMHSDYAVCCDGSDLNIVWTQTGVVQIKIATFSKAEAAWGTRRSEFPMEKVNAIVKMTKIIAALEEWGTAFEERYVYNSPTGPLWPKVNIGAIEGGAPYRPNYFPGVCAIYVDHGPAGSGANAQQARNRLRAGRLQVAAWLRGQERRAAGAIGGRGVSAPVRSKDQTGEPGSRQHLDRHQHLQRAGHSCDQDRSAGSAHQRPQRGDRCRGNAEGGANLRADGAGYLQSGEAALSQSDW